MFFHFKFLVKLQGRKKLHSTLFGFLPMRKPWDFLVSHFPRARNSLRVIPSPQLLTSMSSSARTGTRTFEVPSTCTWYVLPLKEMTSSGPCTDTDLSSVSNSPFTVRVGDRFALLLETCGFCAFSLRSSFLPFCGYCSVFSSGFFSSAPSPTMPSNTSLELELRTSGRPTVCRTLCALAHCCVSENSRGRTSTRFTICCGTKFVAGTVATAEPAPKLFLRVRSFVP